MHLGLEKDDQKGGSEAQKNDTVGEGEAVSQAGELAGEKTVPRQERSKPRKIGEAGVGRQKKDQGGGGLHEVIEGAAMENRPGQLADHRLMFPGQDMKSLG